MNFVEKHLQEKADQTRLARERYDALLHKAAAGDLPEKDSKELIALAEKFGIGLDVMQADIQLLQRVNDLTALAADRAHRHAEWWKAHEAVCEYRNDIKFHIKAMEEEESGMSAFADDLKHKVGESDAAIAELRRLRAERFELLKAPDPAKEANRRHLRHMLVSDIGQPTPDLKYPCLCLQSMIFNSRDFVDIDKLEFIPMPDQPPADLAYLVSLLHLRSRLQSRPTYYLSRDYKSFPAVDGFGIILQKTVRDLIEEHCNPDAVYFIRWPVGQTAEELNELVGDIRVAHDRWLGSKADRDAAEDRAHGHITRSQPE